MGMGRDGGSNVAEEGRGGGEDVQEAMLVTLSYEEVRNVYRYSFSVSSEVMYTY